MYDCYMYVSLYGGVSMYAFYEEKSRSESIVQRTESVYMYICMYVYACIYTGYMCAGIYVCVYVCLCGDVCMYDT